MDDRALEILRTFLGRRGLDTTTERVVTEDLDRVNLYTIGSILVIFSQKDKGLMDRDIRNYVKFATDNSYTNGVIIVGLAKPSENVLKVIKSFAKERIQFFWSWHLQTDWTQHRYYVPHRILKEDEKTALINKYKLTNPNFQFPSIDSQDYPVKVIGAIPGDVIEVRRKSDVAGDSFYYRMCVEDINVV
jgi:DNA-directed RNA polymerase subunit H